MPPSCFPGTEFEGLLEEDRLVLDGRAIDTDAQVGRPNPSRNSNPAAAICRQPLKWTPMNRLYLESRYYCSMAKYQRFEERKHYGAMLDAPALHARLLVGAGSPGIERARREELRKLLICLEADAAIRIVVDDETDSGLSGVRSPIPRETARSMWMAPRRLDVRCGNADRHHLRLWVLTSRPAVCLARLAVVESQQSEREIPTLWRPAILPANVSPRSPRPVMVGR